MNADDTPTTPDDAAERFAAAVEGGAVEGRAEGRVAVDRAVDPELARELEIARRLREQGAAFDPDPEARERARQRLLAALAERAPDNGPSRAS